MTAALDRAISIFGSQAAFAEAIGVRSPSVSGWRRSGSIPADQCRNIELVTRGQVKRVELNQYLFGPIPELEQVPSSAR